jgi:hypothetical protein
MLCVDGAVTSACVLRHVKYVLLLLCIAKDARTNIRDHQLTVPCSSRHLSVSHFHYNGVSYTRLPFALQLPSCG